MGQSMTCTIQQDPNGNDTDTYRDLMCRAWYASTQGIDDTTNSFSTSGDFPNNVTDVDKTIDIPGSGGQGASQLLHEETLRVSKRYGATTDVKFSASLSGINYWGGAQVSDSITYEVPARPYETPSTPRNPSSSSVDSGGANVSWDAPSDWGGDDSGDYDMQWWPSGNYDAAVIIEVWNSRTWHISNADPGTLIAWRVRARNAAGSSGWTDNAYFTTKAVTPSKPRNPGENNIDSQGANTFWTQPSDWGGDDSGNYFFRWWESGNFSNTLNDFGVPQSEQHINGAPANTMITWQVRARNSAGDSDWTDARQFRTDPDAPSAPSTPNVNYRSDDDIRVSWSRNATSAAPYDNIIVQRRVDNGSWSTRATLSGTATSWTDTSAPSNQEVDYRVQGKNSAGTATSGSQRTWTTPSAPSNVKVVPVTGGNATVSWANRVDYGAYTTRVQRQVDGGSWTNVTSGLSNGRTSWVDPNTPSSGDVRYRVRAEADSGPVSSWTASSTVGLAKGAWLKVNGVWEEVVVWEKASGSWEVVNVWAKSGGGWA